MIILTFLPLPCSPRSFDASDFPPLPGEGAPSIKPAASPALAATAAATGDGLSWAARLTPPLGKTGEKPSTPQQQQQQQSHAGQQGKGAKAAVGSAPPAPPPGALSVKASNDELAGPADTAAAAPAAVGERPHTHTHAS